MVVFLSQKLVWLMGGPRLPRVGSHVLSHAEGWAHCLVAFDLARKRREWTCPLNRVEGILNNHRPWQTLVRSTGSLAIEEGR